MYRQRSRLLIVALLLGLFFRYLAAQVGTATLNGTVRDQSGAALPGAAITLAGIEQQFERIP